MNTDKHPASSASAPTITVFGGTAFDANKGVGLLKSFGINSTPVAISDKPDDQVRLYQSPEKLMEVYHKKLNQSNSEYQILYCNSLSFALYHNKYFSANTWGLTKYYKGILIEADLANLAIMVSDEMTAKNLRNFVTNEKIGKGADLQIFPDLELIKTLEKSSISTQIKLIKVELEKFKKNGFTQVLFGCTHLDNLNFENYNGLKIFQPGFRMLDEFIKTVRKTEN